MSQNSTFTLGSRNTYVWKIKITGVVQSTSYSILLLWWKFLIFTEIRTESWFYSSPFSSVLGIDFGICFFLWTPHAKKHYTRGLRWDTLLPMFNHWFAQKEPSILNVLWQRVWIIFVSSDGLRPLNNLIVNIGQRNGYYRRLHVSNKSSEMPRLGTCTVTLL